jgi:hypothetical protein
MDKKKCFKCGKTKDLSMFYVHKQMGDGHLGKCKTCTKTDATAHRNANLDKIRQYDLERSKLPHRKLAQLKGDRLRRKACPFKTAAVGKVARAIKNGTLVRPKECSCCGKVAKIYGHHHDYNKPLDVIWLCQVCHKRVHKEMF